MPAQQLFHLALWNPRDAEPLRRSGLVSDVMIPRPALIRKQAVFRDRDEFKDRGHFAGLQ